MRLAASQSLAGALVAASACNRTILDVNTNPNAPQSVSANLYLPPMDALDGDVAAVRRPLRRPLHAGVDAPRQRRQTPLSTWDRMGYDPASDNGAEQWRDVYWSLGQNLVDMMNKAEAEQRWDLLGVGLRPEGVGLAGADRPARRDHHQGSDRSDAFDVRLRHAGVRVSGDRQRCSTRRSRTCSGPMARSTRRTSRKSDHLYNGDRTKWLKFAYGLLAHQPESLLEQVDVQPGGRHRRTSTSRSRATPTTRCSTYPDNDPALRRLQLPRARARNNVTTYRQTQFVVNLMNGTDFGASSIRA